MSLLRIYARLGEAPVRCAWALLGRDAVVQGEGALAELPRHAGRVQLLIPAAQVLLTRVQLPPAARRRNGAVLAFAVEEASAAEPEANLVSWIGAAGEADALAVMSRAGLEQWRDALETAGMRADEVQSEILLLPRADREWSLAWDGSEGFVRSGQFEGAATDGGDATTPPLALRLMLEAAGRQSTRPECIAVYLLAPEAAPDLAAWQRALDIPLRAGGAWDWRTAPAGEGISFARERRLWHVGPAMLARLRPAAWVAAAALALHGVALVADWTRLGGEQRAVRAEMEARFRSAFPEAVAVADPVLQMRRQLAAARHRAGVSDGGDFAPMLEAAAPGLNELPAGALRILSFEGGRFTLEHGAIGEAARGRALVRLSEAGLAADAVGANQLLVRAP